MAIELLHDGPSAAGSTLILAHGAGAPMDSPFMAALAAGIGSHAVRVGRFEFPYMARRRTGKGGPPDRAAVLTRTWREVIDQMACDHLVIGGKSMGGRYASMIADTATVAGVVCLGYPFHPPGRPDQLRVEHLQTMRTPCLIVQGQRDPFGKEEEVAEYGLSDQVTVRWSYDGDHSFKPRKRSGRTQSENWDAAVSEVVSFIQGLLVSP